MRAGHAHQCAGKYRCEVESPWSRRIYGWGSGIGTEHDNHIKKNFKEKKKKKVWSLIHFPKTTYLIILFPFCKNPLGLTAHYLPEKVQSLLWEIQPLHESLSSTKCPGAQWRGPTDSVLLPQTSGTLHFWFWSYRPYSYRPLFLHGSHLQPPSRFASNVTSSKRPPQSSLGIRLFVSLTTLCTWHSIIYIGVFGFLAGYTPANETIKLPVIKVSHLHISGSWRNKSISQSSEELKIP